MKDRQQFNFITAHISEEEVLGIINALENKTTGPDSIPIKLLKMIPDLIIIPLCRIINFIHGVFPENIKIVKIIPVHKHGSTQDMNNFRPISLLSILDKILEKLMHKRLYEFLENNNIFTIFHLVSGKIILLFLHYYKLQKRLEKQSKKVNLDVEFSLI